MSAEFPDWIVNMGFAGLTLFVVYRKLEEIKQEIARQTQVIIEKIAPQKASAAA